MVRYSRRLPPIAASFTMRNWHRRSPPIVRYSLTWWNFSQLASQIALSDAHLVQLRPPTRHRRDFPRMAPRSGVFAAFASSLPEGLGDLCLDLPSRQTDIVDQMGIVLRLLLKFPAKAYPPAPGRDNASQGRQAVAPTRHFRQPHGRSRPRCLMRGRRKGGVSFIATFIWFEGPGALDVKEDEFCRIRTAS